MIPSPRWTREQLLTGIADAEQLFRQQRMQEPLQAYLDAFSRYEHAVRDLFAATRNLTSIDAAAIDILTKPELLESFRYLTGPPLSQDDLKTLSQALLGGAKLRSDPDMVRRMIQVVQLGLDSRRFPWVSEGRTATPQEHDAAVLASAALMAANRVAAIRRNAGKDQQESLVASALSAAGFHKVPTRSIPTLNKAPEPGSFCGESLLGERKADFVIGLWDNRILALECKVSNSSTNSVKRLNNDAAVKAEIWFKEFGTRQIIPAAVLSGVYKIHNIENAQNRGLTIFWAHDIHRLIDWIASTRVS